MNSHQPVLPIQPAIPLHHGRRPHEMPYHPSPHMHPQAYAQSFQHAYQHGPPQHYQPNPYQQPWYPYQHMPMPMPRPYPPYSPMMSAPYPMQHQTPPLHHRPHPPPPTPSSPAVRSQPHIISPVSPNPSHHSSFSTTVSGPGPNLAPQTPPPPTASVLGPLNQRIPYYPPLPWLSSGETISSAHNLRRRRRKPAPQSSNNPVQLPARPEIAVPEEPPRVESQPSAPDTTSTEEPLQASITLETPATSLAPSETDSTQPTTPSSVTAPPISRPQATATSKPSHRSNPSAAIIPAIPNIPLPTRATKSSPADSVLPATAAPPRSTEVNGANLEKSTNVAASDDGTTTTQDDLPSRAPEKPAPKSWADLVRTKAAPSTTSQPQLSQVPLSSSSAASKVGSLGEVLASYHVLRPGDDGKVSFLEPRGLINTGNMCYMNSILQVLVFCTPFYTFLEKVGNAATHSFQSDTPLMDAMILFLREYKIIDSAESVNKLRMRLKPDELEQYGESFIPEFVYGVIRRLPRFATMRRGHQQDAEEFLGFLLEELHVECSKTLQLQSSQHGSGASTPTNGSINQNSDTLLSPPLPDSEWLEVGRKQKAAITRSSGAISTESPITKIFGGKLRSVLRVPGMKDSVTLEPYQPLQLDIGAPNVTNIIEALKGLTRSETLHGEFNSPRGPGKLATKQVFIETLPQVLILHLKRFQYDNQGGTQKIWKKVGYPLDLEIPKEVFPQHRRPALMNHSGLPRYQLISVVYHHGKNASGGHYTVDVRRQDDREWLRLDDTVLRRIRSEDVAHGGSEEDPKVLAAALEQHNADSKVNKANLFEQLDNDEEDQAQMENGWSEVNGSSNANSGSNATNKKWSGVVNGTKSPAATGSGKMTPVPSKSGIKDNKVAYLLFYQKISG